MATSSQNLRAYSREEWGSLSIQERIKAMNGTVDLGEEPSSTLEETETALLQEQPAALEAPPPPRRVSVVEMWRRRDNQQQPNTGGSSSSSTPANVEKAFPSRSTTNGPTVVVADEAPPEKEEEEEEKKQEDSDEPRPDLITANSSTIAVKPSQVRSTWSQRSHTTVVASPVRPRAQYTAPKKRVVADSPATTTAAADAKVDLTIVPSPSKPPHPETAAKEDEEEEVPSVAPKSRPSHVADFWARRGLKPISANDEGAVAKSGGGTPASTTTSSSSPWKNNDTIGHPYFPNPGVVSSEDGGGSEIPKVSVVDRWKQRVSASDEDQTPEPPASKQPIAERWKQAVKKPETVPPKPRSKVTDRWLNRQGESEQGNPTKNKNFPPKAKVSIPAFLASPTSSRPPIVGRATGTVRAEATTNKHTEDDLATAGELTQGGDSQESLLPAEDIDTGLTLTPTGSPHVTKRWSNRLGGENSPSVSASPRMESPQVMRSQVSPSLPAPRLKPADTPTHTPPHLKTQPIGPSVRTEALHTPDTRAFMPDAKVSAPNSAPSFRLKPQHAALVMPDIHGTSRNIATGATKAHGPSKVSPKLLYEKALHSKNLPRVEGLDGDMEPKLLVLISGQSLSRGQLSTNQQIATILSSHNIPYEEIDGSILSMRERRNELFKISGQWAKYPQFFVKNDGELEFWGVWDDFEQCNDDGKIVDEFAPVPAPASPKRKGAEEKPVEKPASSSPPRSTWEDRRIIESPVTPQPVDKRKNLAIRFVASSETKLGQNSIASDPMHALPTAKKEPSTGSTIDRSGLVVPSHYSPENDSALIGRKSSAANGTAKAVKVSRISAGSGMSSAGSPARVQLSGQPTGSREASPTPSPATSQCDTSLSLSSQASSALSRRDLSGRKARLIGKRLLDKKRELQAHRQRLKGSRSGDSNDPSNSATLNENDVSSSVDGQDAQHGPAHGGYTTLQGRDQPPTNPLLGSDNFESTPEEIIAQPDRVAPSLLKDSTLNYQQLRVSTEPSVKSPKTGSGSPGSEAGLSFLDTPTKSDADSVASRGSALSLRAEKRLKERRQKHSSPNVAVDSMSAGDRKHAHDLTRNVLYGHPDQKKAQGAGARVREVNRLRVDTMEPTPERKQLSHAQYSAPVAGFVQDVHGHRRAPIPSSDMGKAEQAQYTLGDEAADEMNQYALSQLQGISSAVDAYNFSRPNSNANTEGSPSMTRQRATLANRYSTSDRFMDETELEPVPDPTSTKSLPSRRSPKKKASAPVSTRSAPAKRYYDEAYSSSDTRDNTPLNSSDLHSTSSQTSPTRSELIHGAHSEMDSTLDARSEDVRSHYGINDEFTAKSAYNYDAFRSAYSNVTFGQLAADFAGEVSNALNLERLQADVKKAFNGIPATSTAPPEPQKNKKKMVVPTQVPFDEEDVAIEVEYMEPTVQTELSFEEPRRGRRRRAAEV